MSTLFFVSAADEGSASASACSMKPGGLGKWDDVGPSFARPPLVLLSVAREKSHRRVADMPRTQAVRSPPRTMAGRK